MTKRKNNANIAKNDGKRDQKRVKPTQTEVSLGFTTEVPEIPPDTTDTTPPENEMLGFRMTGDQTRQELADEAGTDASDPESGGGSKRSAALNYHVMIRPPYQTEVVVDQEGGKHISADVRESHITLLKEKLMPFLKTIKVTNYMLGSELDEETHPSGKYVEADSGDSHEIFNNGVHLHLYIKSYRAPFDPSIPPVAYVAMAFDNFAKQWGDEAWTGTRVPAKDYKSLNSVRSFTLKNWHIEAGYCVKDHNSPFASYVMGTARKLFMTDKDGKITQTLIDDHYQDKVPATDKLVEMYSAAFSSKIDNDRSRRAMQIELATKNMNRTQYIHDETENDKDRCMRINKDIMDKLQQYVYNGDIVVTRTGLAQTDIEIGRLLYRDNKDMHDHWINYESEVGHLYKKVNIDRNRKMMLERIATQNPPIMEDYIPWTTDTEYGPIPDEITNWIDSNINVPKRRYPALLLYGPRGTAKTAFIRDLGPHMYFKGDVSYGEWKQNRMGVMYNTKIEIPRFVVLDDIQWKNIQRERRKAMWSGENFNVCSASGQQDHKLYHGLPTIIIHNNHKWVRERIATDTDYNQGDVVFSFIAHRLHPEAPARDNTSDEPITYEQWIDQNPAERTFTTEMDMSIDGNL